MILCVVFWHSHSHFEFLFLFLFSVVCFLSFFVILSHFINKKKNTGESNKMSKKVLTFSNNKGETVSYVPDFEKEKSFSVHFSNILKEVQNNLVLKILKRLNLRIIHLMIQIVLMQVKLLVVMY